MTVVTPSTFGIDKLTLGLEGEHHYQNAALAVALAKTWLTRAKNQSAPWTELSEPFIKGLRQCYWPGRSEKIPYSDSIMFHLDGAHTVESMQACNNWWNSLSHEGHLRVLIFNCHHSRDPVKLLQVWATQAKDFDAVIFCPNESGMGRLLEDKREEKPPGLEWQEHTAKVWCELIQQQGFSEVEELLKRFVIVESFPDAIREIEKLQNYSTKNGSQPPKKMNVLGTGSLYLVGTALEVLKSEMCDSFQISNTFNPLFSFAIFGAFFGIYLFKVFKKF